MKITDQQKKSIPFQYAYSVKNGELNVGKRIHQAVDRFFDWIENCPEQDYLDHSKGMMAINFFPTFLNHTKGSLAGTPFVLAPFQQFQIYNIFGWQTPLKDSFNKIVKDSSGKVKYVRRIRKVYDKRARGNGKTAEMAGIALLMMSFDGESESEVYVAATKEQQAKVCWKFAKSYIDHFFSNPKLKKINFRTKQREIIFEPLNSVMMPLGGDSKTQDGLSCHLAIIDEYHAHASDDLLEVLTSSMLKRNQPLTYIITTAGFNTSGVCKNFEDVAKQILDGEKKDDSILIMIHDLDEEDDWEIEANWEKANPLWNHGLNVQELRKSFLETQNQPSKVPNFKTKHLNMWVDSASAWIPSEIWKKCSEEVQEENFLKYGCTGALDLSSTTDFTAFAIISEPDLEGIRDLKVYLFCPKDTIRRRSKEDRVPYVQWVDQGYIIATEGNAVDYSVLEEIVIEEYFKHNIKWVEYDRRFSEHLIQNLQAVNVKLNPFTQTISEYSNPTKQFERLVYQQKIRHGNNPVLNWMLSGCVTIQDTNENIRIAKDKSKNRIDGIIASIMALGGSLTPEDNSKESKYNNQDVPFSFGIPNE